MYNNNSSLNDLMEKTAHGYKCREQEYARVVETGPGAYSHENNSTHTEIHIDVCVCVERNRENEEWELKWGWEKDTKKHSNTCTHIDYVIKWSSDGSHKIILSPSTYTHTSMHMRISCIHSH